MRSKIRTIILLLLIVTILVFLYTKYYYYSMMPTGQAVLSWSASSDSTVKGYKIYYGTEPRKGDCPPGGYAKNLNAGKKPDYTINNLTIGKTYYFSVTSYNSSGKESCFSKEMQKTIFISKWDRLKTLLGFGKK